jgi:hypothetical protein
MISTRRRAAGWQLAFNENNLSCCILPISFRTTLAKAFSQPPQLLRNIEACVHPWSGQLAAA